MNLHSFKESFKKARKLNHLTQESFCVVYKEKTGTSVDIKTVRNWEQGRSTPRINDLIQLADFFGVSTDYLLGRSDCTSVDNEQIRKRIGLNDDAIKALEIAVKESAIEKQFFNLTPIDTLNIMFKHSMLIHIAKSFRNYLTTEYTVPVQYESFQNKFVYSDSNFSKINQGNFNEFPQEYFIHLARTPEHPEDNISFLLSEKNLESMFLQQIEEYLSTIKQIYQEEQE
mgnify:CR=1 FL=1